MERIGFGLRFGAILIDCVIMIVLMMVLGVSGAVGGGFAAISSGAMIESPGYMTTLVAALIPLAYTSFEVFKAATPGKMILKLIICDDNGNAAPREVLIKRWATKYSGQLLGLIAAVTTVAIINTIGLLAGLVIFVGCFFVFGQAKQALHDKVAHTAVYRKAAA